MRQAGYVVYRSTSHRAAPSGRSAAGAFAMMSSADIVRRCSMIFLTVPDDALEKVVCHLVERTKPRAGQLFVHTSGRYGVDILSPLAGLGCDVAAMHPVMTFTGAKDDFRKFEGMALGVTAEGAAYARVREVGMRLGAKVVPVRNDQRVAYHAALALASNAVGTILCDALELLRIIGVPEGGELVLPLVHASVDNIVHVGPRALTGPIVRGDVGTVQLHIDALRERMPAALEAYKALGARTLAWACGGVELEGETVEELRRLLCS